ncbi:DUF2851 family protein [Bacteroidetes/Chlorobi group bacterium Naka2016]|jgi:hypothetical protein|nr:MAG: DUF2851 family protein [Bacteroidetes/Chlorobi group bacterium Naka2016]
MKDKELELQQRIHRLISDPSKVFTTVSGKRLQFLSPGFINREKGPDFRDVAILLNGSIIICDCEFHKNASEWLEHKHSNDDEYNRVGVHIVFNNDIPINQNFETLIIEPELLPTNEPTDGEIEINEFLDTLDELQNYALLRLLRKTSEAKLLLERMPIENAFEFSLRNFLNKYRSRKRRPVYKEEILEEVIQTLKNSEMLYILYDIAKQADFNVPERFYKLTKTRIDKEGKNLRLEILLNCVLPLALALTNEEQRISLFVWFWSTPALNSYGVLTRKFKQIPQNFIWQQQGMLEILYQFDKKTKISNSNFLKIGEVLNFFHIGAPPFP